MRSLETWTLAYLLNSVWQIPLIFLAAWASARALRRSGPAAEHRIWVAALALEVILPACSLQPAQLIQSLAHLLPWSNPQPASHVTTITGPAVAHQSLWLPAQLLTLLAVAYACSVVYFVARLAWSLRKTRALLRNAQPADLTGSAGRTWSHYSSLFNVHDAQLLACPDLSGPVTIGIRRRIVLVPATLHEAFSAEDLSAALAHEFAHMRRRDFARNLLYEAFSLSIAYHPVLWLTRARIAETREMLCDALAAQAVAGPDRYARSLLRLASLLLEHPPATTLHAIGIFDANTFERRLMHLTQKRIQPGTARRLTTVAACIALGLATCASALALRVTLPSPQAATPPAPSEATPAHIAPGVLAGTRLNYVQPVYPQIAKDAKITGSVLLRAIIGKDGTMQRLDVISGPAELRTSTLEAVRHWTYKPYLLNGEPTEVETTITVNYSLAQ